MCDTQVIRQNNTTFFAKNSDREPSEEHIVVNVPAVSGDNRSTLKTTYLTIPQIPDRFGLILSKPGWIWGAEMGVNDQGVVIGNEAVFTRLIEKKGEYLLGMDLLRLGLERAGNARDALYVMTDLLQRFGQGGPAGFRDKAFRYDNSFIIADNAEAWILETAGRWWVGKKISQFGAISNTLSITSGYDLAATGLEDFARKQGYFSGKGDFNFAKAFATRFMPFMAKAHQRQTLAMRCLSDLNEGQTASLSTLVSNLRRHARENTHFRHGSNRDICMHGGGLTRPSQTCGSMVTAIHPERATEIMVTGTSSPCLSLFKPVAFTQNAFTYGQTEGRGRSSNSLRLHDSLWFQFEYVHRRALQDQAFREALCHSRNQLEAQLMTTFDGGLSFETAHRLATEWHQLWHEKARQKAPRYNPTSPYDRFWMKLNKIDGIT